MCLLAENSVKASLCQLKRLYFNHTIFNISQFIKMGNKIIYSKTCLVLFMLSFIFVLVCGLLELKQIYACLVLLGGVFLFVFFMFRLFVSVLLLRIQVSRAGLASNYPVKPRQSKANTGISNPHIVVYFVFNDFR